jgi:hypothetical protein
MARPLSVSDIHVNLAVIDRVREGRLGDIYAAKVSGGEATGGK